MIVEFTCLACGAAQTRHRSPAQVARSGLPKFCSKRCQGDANRQDRECSIDGCTGKHHAHGFCGMHGQRQNRTGDPTATLRRSTEQSFWARVDKDWLGGCWMWTGEVLNNGYGHLASRKPLTPGGSRLAHRASYEFHRGPVPDGLHLDHLCHVRLCVNPDHLEAVTPKENTRRGLHGEMRTHCTRGHELTPQNTAYDARRNCRRCRTCRREADRRRRASVRAQYEIAGRGVG